MLLPLKIRSGLGSGISESRDTQESVSSCALSTERHCRDANCRDLGISNFSQSDKGKFSLNSEVRAYLTPEGM